MRALSLSTLCLSSCAAAAALPYLGTESNDAQISTRKHELMLPCAECAFADRGCSKSDQTSPSYLTLSLTTHEGTLFANDQPIFPPPIPMQFHATQYRGADHHRFQHSDVQVAYAIDARPVSPRPGASLGDIFHLKMNFLDMHGRPATNDVVSIVLLQTATNGLIINDVESLRNTRSPFRARKKLPGSLVDILAEMSPKAPHSPPHKPAAEAANDQPGRSRSSIFHDFLGRIPHPVLLRALLAVSSGILACLVVFFMEWVYLSVRRRWTRYRGLPHPIPVLTVEGEILREEELFSEKKLVEVDVDLMTWHD